MPVWLPDTEQDSVNQLLPSVTGSLKLTRIGAASATPVAALAGVVLVTVGGTSTGGAPAGAKVMSSMARPSSAPVALKSVQRTNSESPTPSVRPVIEPLMAVWFGAALPFNAPSVPALTGATKSSAVTGVHVAALSAMPVALRLYSATRRSGRLAVPRRHCSPV